MIKHVKGNLFRAPEGSVLVHSCNAVGLWGAGIAAQLYKRYPEAFADYVKHCARTPKNELMGSYHFYNAGDYYILSLITSKGVGYNRDQPDVILENTANAIDAFLRDTTLSPQVQIHSPKINSGLFGVPWDDSEAVISTALKLYGHERNWYVWSLE
jgi:ADP-ribose 1''-phosphate phosphatase